MAKETCWNCSAKLATRPPFCPNCGQPTKHATGTERLDFDLRRWREHVANGGAARPTTRVVERPLVSTAPRPAAIKDAPAKERRQMSLPTFRLPKLRFPKVRARDAAPPEEIVIDVDDPFAYQACATCGERDWILRSSRNDEGTFNYWCVRCSRAFKTSVRLPHGPKPFIAAAVVLVILVGMLVFFR